ncbi:MAG: lytic transglycosylase domain-containing protein [bacterium]|nr:lytic transglycosylase domain-containing protein [bacterium]
MGAFALAVMVVFAGSQSADAAVMHSNDNISFAKVEPVAQVKKARVKRSSIRKKSSYKKNSSVKKIYKKKKYTKRKKLRKSLKRVAKRRYSKRKSAKRRYTKRKYAKKSYKRKSYKKRYAKRSSKRKSKGKSFGRGRGSLMATLANVKPAGLPLRLAAAVVTVESGWRVNARGSSGERGLMQLMPATARMMGARGNLYNPRINMRAGTKYLNWCYRRARKNVAATIGCYNRGPGKMWKWSGNPITRRYVSKVRRYMGRS